MRFSVGCGLLVVFGSSAYAQQQPKELADALKAVRSAESVAFKVTANKDAPVEAKYQKGQPIYCLAEKIEFYKKGDVLVYRDGDKWLRSKTGVESDPLRILVGVAKVRRLRLPQDELAGIEKLIKKVDMMVAKTQTFYTCELTKEGCEKLVAVERKNVAQSGQVRFAVDNERGLISYTISIRVKGRIGNAEIDGTDERTVELDAIGTTKVNVPAAAQKALGD